MSTDHCGGRHSPKKGAEAVLDLTPPRVWAECPLGGRLADGAGERRQHTSGCMIGTTAHHTTQGPYIQVAEEVTYIGPAQAAGPARNPEVTWQSEALGTWTQDPLVQLGTEGHA